MSDFQDLPPDLPRPADDGACGHLLGMALPALKLPSTSGRDIDLAALGSGRTVIYCYPRTGEPGKALPTGWDAIPGARGCTPQACAFRDHADEMARLGVHLYGLSAQDTRYQREMATRLHLPFAVLSDSELTFATALRLPTFDVGGERLIKWLTPIIRDNRVEHCFYPVFPPNESARQVVDWLERHG